MNNNTSNNFCKRYLFKYLNCLDLNFKVFGLEHGEEMCDGIKEIIDNSNCDYKKDYNMTLEGFQNKVKENINKQNNSENNLENKNNNLENKK